MLYKYLYIPKYNLLSLCNVTYMCVFMADALALDNQLVYSSLEETFSPTHKTP